MNPVGAEPGLVSENHNRLFRPTLPSLISLFGFNRRVVVLGQRTSPPPPFSSADTHAPSVHCANNRLFRPATVGPNRPILFHTLAYRSLPLPPLPRVVFSRTYEPVSLEPLVIPAPSRAPSAGRCGAAARSAFALFQNLRFWVPLLPPVLSFFFKRALLPVPRLSFPTSSSSGPPHAIMKRSRHNYELEQSLSAPATTPAHRHPRQNSEEIHNDVVVQPLAEATAARRARTPLIPQELVQELEVLPADVHHIVLHLWVRLHV